jgi:AraC-like DNA-binding protein
MKYSETIETHKKLKESVLCYWQMTGEIDSIGGITSRHIPKAQNILVFNYGDQIEYHKATQNISGRFSIFMVPALKSSLIFNQKGKIDLFGISFIRDGLYKLIEMPVSKLNQEFPKSLRNKLEDLYLKIKGRSLIEKRKISETFLQENINQKIGSDVIINAIEIIETSKGAIRVNELAEKIQISDRQIQRLFINRIGVTPKDYCKIIRFNNYLEFILNHRTSTDWMGLVVEFNYHDQPHFIHEVKSISKLSPKKLITYRDSLYDRYTF